MKTKAISVRHFPLVTTDTHIANVAKVSFAKHLEAIELGKVKSLLSYLYRHFHWSPFGHARMCFSLPMVYEETAHLLEHAILAGFSFGRIYGTPGVFCVNGSVWAFYENIQHFPERFHFLILDTLRKQFPICFELMFQNSARWEDLSSQPWIDYGAKYLGANPDKHLLTAENRQLFYVSLHCQTPIYIARQLGKHQVEFCWNEESRRYIDEEPVFFCPDAWRARPDGSIKQGSGGELKLSKNLTHEVRLLEIASLEVYKMCLEENMAPELARGLLLQSMQIEWIWTGSLRALDRLQSQRGPDTHAQKECKDFAEQAYEVFAIQYPEHYGNWYNYTAFDRVGGKTTGRVKAISLNAAHEEVAIALSERGHNHNTEVEITEE